MQIICLSRSAFSGGEQVARALAEMLGYPCLSREELTAAATAAGIRVGKLEMAAVKPRDFCERLAREREHYLAFTTAYLCERAQAGGLVYHGRTGHLLLAGVPHLMRVRVTSSPEQRMREASRSLGVDRERARRYLEEVDEDWRQWAKTLYGRSWEDVLEYDVTINLEKVNAASAAAALVGMSQLPDFQMVPASRTALENLHLAAAARLRLARDERVMCNRLTVRASAGVVTVSYLPQDWRCADLITPALAGLGGVREVRTTMANSNILWIGERFDPEAEEFGQVVEIATRWNAAVLPVRLVPAGAAPAAVAMASAPAARVAGRPAPDGGVEDDEGDGAAADDGGLSRTVDELARAGRSGGSQTVYGTGQELIAALDRRLPCTLAVVGGVFLDKGQATRQRLTRELQSYLGDHLKAPVVAGEELKARYLLTPREAVRSGLYLALVAGLFALVFTHQLPVLRVLSGDWRAGSFTGRGLVALGVLALIPLVALTYGTVAKTVLKFAKME